MCDHLETALEHEDTVFIMNNSINYINKVEKSGKMLLQIKIPTKEMQAQCDDLDMLIHDAETNRDNLGHDLYRCQLKKVRIGNNSEKIPDLNFYHGVIKIQNNNAAGMTTMEHNACSSLLISSADENIADLIEMTYKERKEDFQKQKLGSKYSIINHYIPYCMI